MTLSHLTGRLRWTTALLALPIIGGALALAPEALAATTDYNVCSVTTTINTATPAAGQFSYCMNEVNAAGGNWEIAMAPGGAVALQKPVTLDAGVNLEITGALAPYQATSTTYIGAPASINGSSIPVGLPDEDMFTVDAGANLLLKGVNIVNGGRDAGGIYFAAFNVQGGAEFDNDAFLGDAGYDINADNGGTAPVDISDSTEFSSTSGGGVITDDETQVNMYNDTIDGKALGGVFGNVNLVNTVIAFSNNPSTGAQDCGEDVDGIENITASNSLDTDGTAGQPGTGSCAVAAGSGVTDTTTSALNFSPAVFKGGPVEVLPLKSTSSAIGAGANCLPTDARFYVTAGTDCDAGSYQTTGTLDTSTPVCTAATPNYNAAGGATDTVGVTDAGAGIGPDSITTSSISILSPPGSSGQQPGTVMWDTLNNQGPFAGPTWWDGTSPNLTEADLPESPTAPSTTDVPFSVEAQKQSGDTTVNDTSWSFTATDWAGQSTLCK